MQDIRMNMSSEETNPPEIKSSLKLPRNLKESKELLTINHPGVNLVWKSIKAHRAPNRATLFLYGESGAGKSSTLNNLFGLDDPSNQLIPTSKIRSCTRDVVEYASVMNSAHWNVEGLGIGFIDPPGWGDTEGIDQNIQNLVTIENFISSHPQLDRDEWMTTRVTYPNIVLVVVKGTDNRMLGIDSKMSRMLRVLLKLKVIDRDRPNAVIVVTHAMSIGPPGKYTKNVHDIEESCKLLVKMHFSYDVPVVFIENEHIDYGLETQGDWSILPDGTRQPLNLYRAIIDLMTEAGDEIGIEAVRLFFSNSRKYKVNEIRRVKQCSSEASKRVTHKWEAIIKEQLLTSWKNEVIDSLNKYTQEHPETVSDSQILPLCYHLKEANLVKIGDLSKLNVIQIKRALRPYILNNKELSVLFPLFNIVIVDKIDFHMLGHGYTKELEPRDQILDIKDYKISEDFGISIPQKCAVNQLERVSFSIQYFDGKRRFTINPFRVIFPSNVREIEISFSIYYSLFQVTINDIDNDVIRKDFFEAIKYIEALGENEIKLNEEEIITQFVHQFGVNCIIGLNYGGIIRGVADFTVDSNVEDPQKYFIQLSAEIGTQLEVYFECLQNGQNWSKTIATPEFSEELYDKLKGIRLEWLGGDKKCYQKTLGDINVNTWNDWIDSLDRKFVLLNDLFITTSLSNIVSCSGISCNFSDHFREIFEPKYGSGSQENLSDFSTNPYPKFPMVRSSTLVTPATDQVLTRIAASEVSKSKKKTCILF